jgi:hypothetical protein
MPDIKDLRKEEMEEIIDFYYSIEEYGHIFYGDNAELEGPFKKIMEGMEEIRAIQNKYWSY